MRIYDRIANESTISTEMVSDRYLQVNSAGCQLLEDRDYDMLRPIGRMDWHILYISEGCCYVKIGEDFKAVPKGNIVVFRPHKQHHYKFFAKDKSVSYFLHFTGNSCEELLDGLSPTLEILALNHPMLLEDLFQKIVSEWHLKRYKYENVVVGYLGILLSLICRESEEIQSEKMDKRIEQVVEYMMLHYADPIDLDKYAEMCYISKIRFLHLFKDVTGKAPYQYQLDLRLENAQSLLANTSFNVMEVSNLVGFKDPSYFSRLFKKHTGYSPRVFKEKA